MYVQALYVMHVSREREEWIFTQSCWKVFLSLLSKDVKDGTGSSSHLVV